MDFYFLSNYMEYDRGDSFTFFFEANGILFILKSEGKLSPSPKNIQEKTQLFFNTKISKSDYISKTKDRTKKIIYVKTDRQVSSNLPCEFCLF